MALDIVERNGEGAGKTGLTPITGSSEMCKAARIVALLAGRMMTNQQIADALQMTRTNVIDYTNRLRYAEPKRLFVASWRNTPRATPLYMAGDKSDAEFVPNRKPKAAESRSATQLARVTAALAVPRTAAEVATIISRSMSSSWHYIAILRKERKVHIKAWAHPGHRGDLAPVYALGNKPDAPKPRESRAERYAKETSDPAKRERLLANNRKQYHKVRGLPPPPPANPFAALFAQPSGQELRP